MKNKPNWRGVKFAALKDFLESLNRKDFEENIKIKKGESIDDIELFDKDKSKIPFDQVINYGDFFLVDILGGDLSVCELSKRKHKLPNGRVVKCKFLFNIIEDCHKTYGTALNGYWIIPPEFLSEY